MCRTLGSHLDAYRVSASWEGLEIQRSKVLTVYFMNNGFNLETGESDSESCSVVSDSLLLHGLYRVHEILQARTLEWVSSQPRFQTQVYCVAGGLLPSEPPGKSKNTGVGRLSLFQRIFLIQESNWGLLHCRWILYQLS